MRVREWPWRRKVALGAWVPVAVVGFFLFTGPNGSPSGATTDITPQPKTVTTLKALPPRASVKQIADGFRAYQQTQEAVSRWINAMPPRLTLAQQLARSKWRAARVKALVQDHKAATAIANHRDQKTR
jgi:hypothetical protein